MDTLNISDLQISLIIIGIVIIAGVMIFNWVQQSRYQRKVQDAFEYKHEDVLLDEDSPLQENDRIEPKFNQKFMQEIQADSDKATVTSQDSDMTSTVESTVSSAKENSDDINYVVSIRSEALIPDEQLTALHQQQFDFGKPVHWYGKHEKNDPWEEIAIASDYQHHDFTQLKGSLQLVDRSGPVSELSLSKFRDLAEDIATQSGATADCSDIMNSYEQAVLIDKFCVDVDVMIGINIVSKDEGAFVGTKIRALAEASGFKLGAEGEFKYCDENDLELFTLTNFEPTKFSPENMKLLTTQGITFLLDVPRVAQGEKVFDQMTHIARIFANTLGGIMVDDNRVPLSDNGIARSKQQLIEIKEMMEDHTIPAGSKNAMKLFI